MCSYCHLSGIHSVAGTTENSPTCLEAEPLEWRPCQQWKATKRFLDVPPADLIPRGATGEVRACVITKKCKLPIVSLTQQSLRRLKTLHLWLTLSSHAQWNVEEFDEVSSNSTTPERPTRGPNRAKHRSALISLRCWILLRPPPPPPLPHSLVGMEKYYTKTLVPKIFFSSPLHGALHSDEVNRCITLQDAWFCSVWFLVKRHPLTTLKSKQERKKERKMTKTNKVTCTSTDCFVWFIHVTVIRCNCCRGRSLALRIISRSSEFS